MRYVCCLLLCCVWLALLHDVCADEIVLPAKDRSEVYLPPLKTTLVRHELDARSKAALQKVENIVRSAVQEHEHRVQNKKAHRKIYARVKKTAAPCHEKKCALVQQKNDEQENALLLDQVYRDPELIQKKISLHIKKTSIKNALEMINKLSDMSFVVDPHVTGDIDEVKVQQVPLAIALQLILNGVQPRLGLVKTLGVWRVMHHALALELLRVNALQQRALDYGSSTHTMHHAKWDDKFKVRLEKLWDGVIGDQKGKPGTYIAFDDNTKKVFFKGRAQQVQDFEAMLQEIDVESPQVRLDIRVIIADKNFEEMLGFQWSGRYDRQTTSRHLQFTSVGAKTEADGTSKVNNPFGAVTDWSLNLIPGWKAGENALKTVANSDGMFSMPFIFKNKDYTKLLNLTLNAAETRHEITTLLKPSLLVNNEENAEILVGESMPLQTMVAESVGSNISNVTTTQYKDLGIKVNVKPVVCPGNDSVFLDIFLENSSLTPLTTAISWDQGNNAGKQSIAYTIKTSRSKNRVLLHSGQTTLISGLIVNSRDTMKSGVPILQEIPVLGWLFRGTKKSVEDKQLLIFITPMIV